MIAMAGRIKISLLMAIGLLEFPDEEGEVEGDDAKGEELFEL